MNRIGLIGAMPVEVAPILERLENARTECAGPVCFHTGTLFGKNAVVLCCGVGKVNAAMGAQAMIQKYAPELIIHMGVGGGLVPHLKIGDVVAVKACVQYDVDTSAVGDPVGLVSTVNRIFFECDSAVMRGISEAVTNMRGRDFGVYEGIAATGDQFLTHRRDKEWIVDTFGAAVCDQESCAIAQVCFVHRIPVAVVRAVSDVTDGAHGEEYRDGLSAAAANAGRSVLEYLEKCRDK